MKKFNYTPHLTWDFKSIKTLKLFYNFNWIAILFVQKGIKEKIKKSKSYRWIFSSKQDDHFVIALFTFAQFIREHLEANFPRHGALHLDRKWKESTGCYLVISDRTTWPNWEKEGWKHQEQICDYFTIGMTIDLSAFAAMTVTSF